MNRFIKANSLFARAMGWFFAASLFCDGANLDDIFSRSIILHDDEEVIGACQDSAAGSGTGMFCDHPRSSGETGLQPSAPLTRTPVRVIIDQDSPSLAAEGSETAIEPLPNFEDSPVPSSDVQRAVERLHLRFHSLLI